MQERTIVACIHYIGTFACYGEAYGVREMWTLSVSVSVE
jgi:hypothetical protein